MVSNARSVSVVSARAYSALNTAYDSIGMPAGKLEIEVSTLRPAPALQRTLTSSGEFRSAAKYRTGYC